MKKVISFCLIACLLLTSLLCFAADDSVSCSFDGNELTVSAGAGAFESNTMVELVVVKPGKTLADISDAAAVVLTDSAKTGRLGSVSFKKSVSLNEEGKYKVYLIPSGSGPALNGEVRGTKGSGVEIVSAECSGGKQMFRQWFTERTERLYLLLMTQTTVLYIWKCVTQQTRQKALHGTASRHM